MKPFCVAHCLEFSPIFLQRVSFKAVIYLWVWLSVEGCRQQIAKHLMLLLALLLNYRFMSRPTTLKQNLANKIAFFPIDTRKTAPFFASVSGLHFLAFSMFDVTQTLDRSDGNATQKKQATLKCNRISCPAMISSGQRCNKRRPLILDTSRATSSSRQTGRSIAAAKRIMIKSKLFPFVFWPSWSFSMSDRPKNTQSNEIGIAAAASVVLCNRTTLPSWDFWPTFFRGLIWLWNWRKKRVGWLERSRKPKYREHVIPENWFRGEFLLTAAQFLNSHQLNPETLDAIESHCCVNATLRKPLLFGKW